MENQNPAVFRAAERAQAIRAKTAGSLQRLARAEQSLAGGVSSGLRRGARPHPLYFDCGSGSEVVDVDGNRYLDYGLAWGPLILGHAPKAVTEAVAVQLERGWTFGAQHDLEYEVAEKLTRIIPCADRVCYANSGTEAVQVALRLARAATGRIKLLKFEGHYHGWDDSVLVSYHPGAEHLLAKTGMPTGAGLGQRPHNDILVAEWNDKTGVEALFAEHPGEIAAVICEPMLCNSGCIPPRDGFLDALREAATRHGALLIFDEVITGFRLHLQGAQGFYGVEPDLAVYAKAVGGGAPLSVIAGRARVMDLIGQGKVIHAGTLNGNPIALAAANATLDILARDGGAVFQQISQKAERLRQGLQTMLRDAGFAATAHGGGAVFHVSFLNHAPRNYREGLAADQKLYEDFAVALLDEGILVLPDGRWYLSTAHSDEDIDRTLAAAKRIVSEQPPPES